MAERKLTVQIVGDEKDLLRAFTSSSKAAEGFNARVTGVGRSLSRTLTPAAAAVAAVGAAAFADWDAGLDKIRVQTGATGDRLKQFEGVMKAVGGSSTQSLAQVGQTIGELNQRLGLTGKPLAEVSKRFLELDRIGIPASVENVTRVFGDWSVKTKQQAAVMDELFRASQGSGVSIDDLSSSVVRFGAPLRQMGFGLAQATALVGKFEKEGVNTNLVMGSMRIALGRLAQAGKEPVKAFQETVAQIRQTGSVANANRKAIELFGARAGPDMAAAIREGRFEIGKLFAQVTKGRDSISKASQDTLDWGDRLQMLKNRVVGTVGPYGQFVAVVGGGLAAIGPTLFAVGQMAPLLGKLATATKIAAAAQWALNIALTANPIGAIIVGVAALATGLVIAWKHSETFRRVVKGAFAVVSEAAAKLTGAFKSVLDFLRTHWRTIAVVISGPFAPLVALATDAFGIRSALVGAFRAVRNSIQGAMQGVREGLLRAVAAIGGAARRIGKAITDGILGGLGNLAGALKKKVTGALDSVVGSVKGLLRIGSPSRVFLDIGQAMGDGLRIGLERSVKGLEKPLARQLDVLERAARAASLSVGVSVRESKPQLLPDEITRGGIRSTQKLLKELGPIDAEAARVFQRRNLGVSTGSHASAFGFAVPAVSTPTIGGGDLHVHIHGDVVTKGDPEDFLRQLQKRAGRSASSRRGRYGGTLLGLG